MRTLRSAIVVMSAVLAASSAFAGEPSCVREGQHALVEWRGSESARLYFHSGSSKAEHYIEMTRTGDRAWAVLPKPAAGTDTISYRIAVPVKGSYVTRVEKSLSLNATCAVQTFTADQARATASIVVGTTSDNELFPAGFLCDGIAAQISAKGVLVARNACADIQAAQLAQSEGVTAENSQTQKGSSTPVVSDAGVGVTRHVIRPPRKPPTTPPNPVPRRPRPVSQARP